MAVEPVSLMPGFQAAAQQLNAHMTVPMMQQPVWDSSSWSGLPAMPQIGLQQSMLQSDMPPISQMLMREADAWRALLGLHGSVLNLSRGIASASIQYSSNMEQRFDEQCEVSQQREASYVASIAQLVSQCDTMVAEAIKIRGLRKAMRQAETESLKEILRTHSDEALATGDALARNSAMSFSAAVSEMRQAAQSIRTQIQQARGLLQAASELKSLGSVDSNTTIVMGYLDNEGAVQAIRPISKILEQVYQRGQLTNENLRASIWEGDVSTAEPAAPRTFSRRAGDRGLQQQLVKGQSVTPNVQV